MEGSDTTEKDINHVIHDTISSKKSRESLQEVVAFNDDVRLLGKDEAKESFTCLQKIKTLTIEPFVFFFLFSYILGASCLNNMILDKGCRYYLNFSEEICSNLSGHAKEKETAEILANNYGLYCNLMSLIAAFQMVFIAPWSDKYGRRIPLILAGLGVVASDVCVLLCAIFYESELFYIVLAKIPSELFGGIICMFTIVFSHASEVSSDATRPLKYMTVELALGLSLALGGVTGGMLFKYYGYVYVYITATAVHLLAVLWVVGIVQETTGLQVTKGWKDKLKDVYVTDSLARAFKATFRRRENFGREFLILFFISMSFMVLSYESFGNIGFIFAHHILDWDQGTYTIVNTVFSTMQMVVLVLFIPLMVKVFKVKNAVLGLIGVISMMGKFGVIAFTAKYHVYIYYIGSVVGFFSSLIHLSIRTEVSRIVNKEELGLVFSFFATVETIVPMFGTVLITKVFNSTMDIYPSVSYLMTSFMMVIPLGTFTWACFNSVKGKEQPDKVVSSKAQSTTIST